MTENIALCHGSLTRSFKNELKKERIDTYYNAVGGTLKPGPL